MFRPLVAARFHARCYTAHGLAVICATGSFYRAMPLSETAASVRADIADPFGISLWLVKATGADAAVAGYFGLRLLILRRIPLFR